MREQCRWSGTNCNFSTIFVCKDHTTKSVIFQASIADQVVIITQIGGTLSQKNACNLRNHGSPSQKIPTAFPAGKSKPLFGQFFGSSLPSRHLASCFLCSLISSVPLPSLLLVLLFSSSFALVLFLFLTWFPFCDFALFFLFEFEFQRTTVPFSDKRNLSQTCVRKSSSLVNVRIQPKKDKKHRRKRGLAVTAARLPSGCSCNSMAATRGHHRWDWAFPHGSHKQRTHFLVSVFLHTPSASMLCVVVALFAW